MSVDTVKVWYLRNGDIEQVVACDHRTAMQLLGSISGHVGELPPEMDPDGQLRSLVCRHEGTIYTKLHSEPFGAWTAAVA